MKTRNRAHRQQHGFSLIEMLIVVGIMGIISAVILSQMNEAQQRGYSEQVSIDKNAVQFEGDMIGNGVVQSIIYKVNGSGTCRLCLQRSQVDKVLGNPLPTTTPGGAQGQNWGTEANDVLSDPIFTYFKADGTPIPNTSLPLDISTFAGAQTLASIKTIKISLTIRNNSG